MIRIGIVGCGRILAAHLRGYRQLREAGVDNFRITALCARRAEDAQMYVQRGAGPPQRPPVSDIPGDPLSIGDEYLSDFQDVGDVEVYTDYRRMIAEGAIDAVNDFTTHAMHHQVAEHAFQHGKDLLTQKPLAVSMEAGRRMCHQAEEAGRVLGVFENFRNNPATRQLRWAFDSGRCGDLQMVLLGFVGVWWAPNRIVAETPWRHRLDEAGGIALDLGVHFLDQIRYVAGEVDHVAGRTAILEPRRVTPRTGEEIECDADDTFFADIATRKGVVGNLFASWGGHGQPLKVGQGVCYYGTKGRITGDEVSFDDGSTASLSALYEAEADARLKEQHFPLGITNGFALNQLDWLRAIDQRREPETSGREGLRDLAAAFSILESAHTGRRTDVEQVLDGDIRDYQRPIDQRFGLL